MAQLHLKALISLALVAVISAACSTSPTGRSQVILKSDEELAVEASRQFVEMKANMPLETDRAKIDYIHQAISSKPPWALKYSITPPDSRNFFMISGTGFISILRPFDRLRITFLSRSSSSSSMSSIKFVSASTRQRPTLKALR